MPVSGDFRRTAPKRRDLCHHAHVSVRTEEYDGLSVRLVAETVSVPGARRFVRDGLLEWQREALVEDATLCVTELAANAALHSGSRFMEVTLRDLGGGVELAVTDDAPLAGIEAISPRTSPAMRATTAPDALPAGPAAFLAEPTTGRGLAIVSMLAHDWGVTDARGRRRVWAVVAPGEEAGTVHPPTRRADRPADALPRGWKEIVVPQAPVALSVRIDEHIDEVIRELQLVDASPSSPTAELAALIQRLISVPFARHTGRAQALDALERGLEHVDIVMPVPREAAGQVRDLLDTMRAADELCRSHQLLAVPATEEMDLLREWFTHNMVGQLEHDAEPVSYDAWLAGRQATVRT